MRFLCLHGQGTNAEIFQSQLSRLAYVLQQEQPQREHEFEFIEGELPCMPAAGIAEMYPEQTEFFEYFNSSDAGSVQEAVDGVHELLASEASEDVGKPFDGIIGFSQGAFLALTVLAEQARDHQRSPALKCAVLLCAGKLPYDFSNGRFYEPSRDGCDVVKVPTFHLYGRRDDAYAIGLECSRLCAPTLRRTYEHKGGHEIPKTAAETALLAGGLEKCIEKALLVH